MYKISIVFLFCVFQLPAQVVNRIFISGNTSTKEEFIKNSILKTKEGDVFVEKDFQQDCKNLSTLASIASVNYSLDTNDLGITIYIEIEEITSLYPWILFNTTNKNYQIGIGGGSLNLFKRAHQLFTSYRYEKNNYHSYSFYYSIPFVANSKWGIGIGSNRFHSPEPAIFPDGTATYDYLFRNYTIDNSYAFTVNHRIGTEVNYFTENFLIQATSGETMDFDPPTNKTNKKIGFTVYQKLFRLDYFFHRVKGWKNRINYMHISDLIVTNTFNSIENEWVYYNYKTKFMWALRGVLSLSDNGESAFAPFLIDSYKNIRGVGNRIVRSNNQLVFNSELRYDWFNLSKNILSQAVLFSDVALADIPYQKEHDLYTYMGVGGRLVHLKGFNYVLRVDYGINIQNIREGGAVIGFGHFF